MEEFEPVNHYYRVLKLGWLIVLTALLGGITGYLFHRAHPPVYEAVATFSEDIDFSQIKIELTQYDEDLALAALHGALISSDVLQKVIDQAAELGITVDGNSLYNNSSVERLHGLWQLRYRNSDAQVAQVLVNFWAQAGYAKMLAFREEGILADYVVIRQPSLAGLPRQPVNYDRNKLILGGAIIGLVIGILLAEQLARKK